MISVVIVHWNTPELLKCCLQSVQESTSPLVGETIVVDCDSTRGSVEEIVNSACQTRLVQLDTNSGYAAGCNAGYREASKPIVLFLNADVVLDREAITAIAACFSLNPRIGLVAPLLFNRDGTLQSAGYSFPGLANIAFDLLPLPDRLRASRLNGRRSPGSYQLPYRIAYPLGAAFAVRAEALDDVGGWNEEFGMYSEEIDLCRQLELHGWTRILEPRARMTHFGGASTSQRPVEMETALWRSRGLYHRRWSPWLHRFVARMLVETLTRVGGGSGRGAAVRTAFAAGLRR